LIVRHADGDFLGEPPLSTRGSMSSDVTQPAAVESRVSGIIGGVKIAGYADLLDTERRLIDSKGQRNCA
jgi:hypothetical protein